MRRLSLMVLAASLAAGCGGGSAAVSHENSSGGAGGSTSASSGAGSGGSASGGGAAAEGEFQISESQTAGDAHGESPSEITATRTHAAMRLFVVDRENGPISGVVVKMTGPDGISYYTHPTDSVGYGEVLVPVNRRYEMEYLALGRRNAMASVQVPDGPNQDIRLTMRYRRVREPEPPPPPAGAPAPEEPRGLVLEGVLFNTGAATIQEDSFPRLDRVVEYMTYQPNSRVRVGGHTDNVGNRDRNQQLSEERAQAVRQYLIDHGIDGGRVEAVGYGDSRPVTTNETEEGRRLNRRIEAVEL